MNYVKRFLRKYIEKHYDFWGTKIEADLPPEFVITDHALDSFEERFNCRPDKRHKIMVKAWASEETPDYKWIKEYGRKHEKSIYKIFQGFIFVFRIRYNKRLGASQKYLVTVYKKNGYQFYGKR